MKTELAQYSRLLLSSEIFYGVVPQHIEILAAAGQLVRHVPGVPFLKQRDLVLGLSIVLEGEVEIKKGSLVLDRLGPGNFFGEISLFGQTIGATADVLTPAGCTLLTLSRREFDSWYAAFPENEVVVLRNMAGELCRRLQATTEKLALPRP